MSDHFTTLRIKGLNKHIDNNTKEYLITFLSLGNFTKIYELQMQYLGKIFMVFINKNVCLRYISSPQCCWKTCVVIIIYRPTVSVFSVLSPATPIIKLVSPKVSENTGNLTNIRSHNKPNKIINTWFIFIKTYIMKKCF